MAVHDTQDDDIVALRSIDDKVGQDNSDADVAAETWAWAAGAWMRHEPLEGRAEPLCAIACNQRASPSARSARTSRKSSTDWGAKTIRATR